MAPNLFRVPSNPSQKWNTNWNYNFTKMDGLKYFREARLSNDRCLIRHLWALSTLTRLSTLWPACSGRWVWVCVKMKQECHRSNNSSQRDGNEKGFLTQRLKFGRETVPIEDGGPDPLMNRCTRHLLLAVRWGRTVKLPSIPRTRTCLRCFPGIAIRFFQYIVELSYHQYWEW